MGLRAKFLALTAFIIAILALVLVVGYYTAERHLTQSIDKELNATVSLEANDIGAWIKLKAQNVITIAGTMEHLDPAVRSLKEMTSCMDKDADILDFYNGTKDGDFIKWGKSAIPEGYDPRTRVWYKAAQAENGLIFTGAYIDALTGKQVVTAAYPYKNAAGAFAGAIASDISLEILNKQVDKIKINGQGVGFILDKSGTAIAHANPSLLAKKIEELPALKDHARKILESESGLIAYESDGERMVLAYAKVEGPGWIVGMEVPAAVIYAEIDAMRMNYLWIAALGVIIMIALSMRFANKITNPILSLTQHADQMASGNLRMEKLDATSKDEIGKLMRAFNAMSDNLRGLIQKISASSEQIAAASEELTAGANQSAEASDHVAASTTEVANGMAAQIGSIGHTMELIEFMAGEVDQVSGRTEHITEISGKTAKAAQTGEKLMREAIDGMTRIEQTVNQSAAVVARLGDNSKQIGQIVSVISGIAGQTNLLALNAAIEAARAGEQGKGFAVVAEEVRKLAEQSQQATEEITKLIAHIQADTAQAVTSMESGTNEVKVGSAAIRNVGGAFEDILSMVGNISSKMQEIAKSVSQVSGSSREIVGAIKSVDEVSKATSSQAETISAATEEQSAAMEEIATSSQSLANMAQEMQAMVSKFKI